MSVVAASNSLIGSACRYVSYCSGYTEWGRCTGCNAGYYLNKDSTCAPCNKANCATCDGPD